MIAFEVFLFLIALQLTGMVRREVHIQRYRYRLFALRDRLRRMVIEDRELGKSWLFPYLDSTISGAIGMLPYISLWQGIFLVPVAEKRREKVVMLVRQLRHQFSKRRYAGYREIYDSLWREIASQLSDRHFVIRAQTRLLKRGFNSLSGLVRRAGKRERRSFQSVLLKEPQSVVGATAAPEYALTATAH